MSRLFVLLVSLLSCHVNADATLELRQLLAPINSLAGGFEQGLYAIDGEQLETSSGRFSLLQPDNFRWQIESPEAQLVVVSGGFLWHHDVELETVTRRRVDGRSAYSPLAVLAGDEDSLRRDYTVEALPGADALSVWRLLPRSAEADFREIILEMCRQASASLRIYSPVLEHKLFDSEDLM